MFEKSLTVNHRKIGVPYCKYNCFGFVAGIPEWMITTQLFNPIQVELERYGESFAYKMKWEFLGIAKSELPKVNSKREELVMLRFSGWDFHFVVKKRNGKFYHKPGKCLAEEVSKEWVLKSDWGNSYHSGILCFRKVLED